MDVIPITYVGNDDVITHITTLGKKKKKPTSQGAVDKLAATFVDSTSNVSRKKTKKKEGNIENNDFNLAGSIELLADTLPNPSDKVYAFKTPKRSKQMSKYASESVRKIRGKTSENVEPSKENISPPNNISENNKYSVQHIQASRDGDTSVNEDESGEDSSSDEDGEQRRMKIMRSCEAPDCIPHVPSHRLQLPSERDLYFDSHGSKRSTSDHTLSRLRNPRLGSQQINDALEQHDQQRIRVDKDVESAKANLGNNYKLDFTKWMFYLSNDFNILLFGLGSKRSLLHLFCERTLKSETKLVANGFFPGLSLKSILSSITEDILKVSLSAANHDVTVDHICQHYGNEENNSDHLFLVIHNIDGLTLRGAKAQQVLSRLAQTPRIHLIASIDHINAPLIWDQSQMSRFEWLWYDVTTYTPYTEETSYEGSLLLAGTGAGMGSRGAALALSGLLHVARSLTSNARGVFRILAEHELAQAEERGEKEEGEEERANSDFSFCDLYQKCREGFLVNSELTLRAHLTEFLDHRLVAMRKGIDGGEYLSVPLDSGTLKEYLERDDV